MKKVTQFYGEYIGWATGNMAYGLVPPSYAGYQQPCIVQSASGTEVMQSLEDYIFGCELWPEELFPDVV